MYVETESVEGGSWPAPGLCPVKRSTDLLTFVKVPIIPLNLVTTLQVVSGPHHELLGTVTVPSASSWSSWLDAVQELPAFPQQVAAHPPDLPMVARAPVRCSQGTSLSTPPPLRRTRWRVGTSSWCALIQTPPTSPTSPLQRR